MTNWKMTLKLLSRSVQSVGTLSVPDKPNLNFIKGVSLSLHEEHGRQEYWGKGFMPSIEPAIGIS